MRPEDRLTFFRNAHSERYKRAKETDPHAVREFEDRAESLRRKA